MDVSVIKKIALAVGLVTAQAQAASLLDSVNEALATNPEIAIRTNASLAISDEVRQARAGYYPRVDFSAGAGFERIRNQTTMSNDDDKNYADQKPIDARVTATQMLFDGFSTQYSVDRQKARNQSSEQEVCSIAETVGEDTTRAFLNVIRSRSLMDSAKENLAEHEQIVDLIRQNVRGGLSSQADISQAEGRLVLAHANYITTQASARDAETIYRRLVGNLPESFDEPSIPGGLPANIDMAIQEATDNHPVLKRSASDINAAEAQYDATKSTFMPRVELALTASWGEDQGGTKGTTYDHTAMLRVNYNLFNGGGDSARRSQASNLINEAIEVRNRVYRQVTEEVNLAYIAMDFGEERLKSLTEHVALSKNSRDLYKKQFQGGSRTLLDVLDSQGEYFSAVNAQVDGHYDLLQNQYRLKRSTGTLLLGVGAELPAGTEHCTASL